MLNHRSNFIRTLQLLNSVHRCFMISLQFSTLKILNISMLLSAWILKRFVCKFFKRFRTYLKYEINFEYFENISIIRDIIPPKSK